MKFYSKLNICALKAGNLILRHDAPSILVIGNVPNENETCGNIQMLIINEKYELLNIYYDEYSRFIDVFLV